MLAKWLLILGLIWAVPQDPPTETTLDEIVVDGSLVAPIFDVFAPFEAICFDGNRRYRTARTPEDDDANWFPLAQEERGRLGVAASAKAFHWERSDLSLILKIEEGPSDGDVQDLQRNRCVLTVIGRHDTDDLRRGMTRLFGTPGTDRHVGRIPGYVDIPGWRQWAWTAIPNKNSSQWRGFESTEGNGYVVVNRAFFYRSNAWIIGDLKHTKTGDVPVSELSLTYRYRP